MTDTMLTFPDPNPTTELIVGVNTYIDIDYDVIDDQYDAPIPGANQYFATRLHSSVWTNASNGDRANALRQATALLDTLSFTGRKATTAQALAWPRVCARDRDGYAVPSDTVPQDILNATCEWALHLLTHDPSKPKAVVIHKQVGDLQTDYAPMLPDTLPPMVRTLLQPYLRTSANTAEIVF